MPIALSQPLRAVFEPVFDACPFDQAMEKLVIDQPEQDDAHAAVTAIADDPALADRPELLAGLWLYVDDLDRAHALAQSDNTPTGSFWHAIIHRREGDFDNARYWYRKAHRHPAMSHIDLTGGGAGSGTDVARYDPAFFVNRVEKTLGEAGQHPALISEQRKEWKALFEWCAAQTP